MATECRRTRFSSEQIPATFRCQFLTATIPLHARLLRISAGILQDGDVHGFRFSGRTAPADCIFLLPVAGGAATGTVVDIPTAWPVDRGSAASCRLNDPT